MLMVDSLEVLLHLFHLLQLPLQQIPLLTRLECCKPPPPPPPPKILPTPPSIKLNGLLTLLSNLIHLLPRLIMMLPSSWLLVLLLLLPWTKSPKLNMVLRPLKLLLLLRSLL